MHVRVRTAKQHRSQASYPQANEKAMPGVSDSQRRSSLAWIGVLLLSQVKCSTIMTCTQSADCYVYGTHKKTI